MIPVGTMVRTSSDPAIAADQTNKLARVKRHQGKHHILEGIPGNWLKEWLTVLDGALPGAVDSLRTAVEAARAAGYTVDIQVSRLEKKEYAI